MATEDYKGQFKSLSKDLGLSVKEIRAMPDYDLEMLIEHRRDLREQAQTIREMGGAMNKGGMPKKKKVPAIAISVGMVDAPKNGKNKAKMMRGGIANKKEHMYAAGGSVKDNAGLRALRKASPEAYKKITGK